MIGAAGWPCQMAFVVDDIEASMQHWTSVLGVGPFVYLPKISGAGFRHEGQLTDINIAVALSYIGDTQIELIEQKTGGGPSPYREFMEKGRGGGVQHFGLWSDDMPAAAARLAKAGYREAFSAPTGSIYYRPPGDAGPMIELSQASPVKLAAFDTLRNLAREWDGARPIRTYDSFKDFLTENSAAKNDSSA